MCIYCATLFEIILSLFHRSFFDNFIICQCLQVFKCNGCFRWKTRTFGKDFDNKRGTQTKQFYTSRIFASITSMPLPARHDTIYMLYNQIPQSFRPCLLMIAVFTIFHHWQEEKLWNRFRSSLERMKATI